MNVKKQKSTKSKFSLIRSLSITTLIIFIIFAVFFGYGISRMLEKDVLQQVVDSTSKIINENVNKHFIEGDLLMPMGGLFYDNFTLEIAQISWWTDISALRIWNRDMVVWASEKELIGRHFPDNKALIKSLKGESVVNIIDSAKIKYKDNINANTKLLVEMYIPVRFSANPNNVRIVFEIYKNVDPYVAAIARHRKIVWLSTFLGFAAMYLVMSKFMWKVSKRIDRQTDQLKKAATDWRNTFDSAKDVIVMLDKDFKVAKANWAAVNFFNLNYLQLIESHINQLFASTDLAGNFNLFSKIGQSKERIETETIFPEKQVWVSISLDPILDEQDMVTGSVLIMRDITEIKNSEEEREKLQEQLFHVHKLESIGRLAGAVAHDFNNLISVISGFSELALKELPDGSSLRDNIEAIHTAGDKAAAITHELLAFSRKQVLEMKVVNINSIIKDMTMMLSRLIGDSVILSVATERSNKNILADSIQIEQIILNLAINARDSMPEGGNLFIAVSDEEFASEYIVDGVHIDPGAYVMISVLDTGIGISREMQKKIFEPFFTTKEVGRGTGMGLATVYGIIKQHKGYVTVHSEENKGTEFKIYFPVTDGEVDVTASSEPDKAPFGNETIMVVDDEPLVLKVIVNMLKPLGYNVLQASSGKEALEKCDRFGEKIDLLLTDVIMPGMNGKKVAEILVSQRPDIKVIFISGYSDDAISPQGVLEKGTILVHKPLKEMILAKKIREVLDGKYINVPVSQKSCIQRTLQILLADDNEDIQKLIKVYLKDSDCKIDMAENGKRAVEQFQQGKYDIVLMDMQMPVMDGITATEEIREWEQANGLKVTPIIALTGSSSCSKYIEAGCTAYIAKPVKKDQLIAALFSQSTEIVNDRTTAEPENIAVAHVEEDLRDIIPDFFKKKQADINTIQSALEKCDYETIRILGHSMKGSGGSYGFDMISDIGLQMENAAIEENAEEVYSLSNKLSDYIKNVKVIYD